MSADETRPFDFHLFVSYSHQSDYRLTRKLESFLESFHKRVPAHARERLAPLAICTDGSDFKLAPHSATSAARRDVPEVIVQHLEQSRELLVLCSAAAARSDWVNREIEWFAEHRGPGSIRLALTEGVDPLSEPEVYFAPSALALGLQRSICYDLRGFSKERAHAWSKVADFERESVRLAADLNGVAAGEVYPLWLVEERRRTRLRTFYAAAAAVLILSGVGFGAVQRAARQVAQANEKLAQVETSHKEAARQVEQEKRKAADANARTQQALRLVSDAFERLYRDPTEALQLAAASRELEASATGDRALADAYRVAILRNENRRQARRLTGSGPGYLASRWSEANLTSVISPDGRYLVVITPRGRDGVTGPDGKPMPGELYLIDNETQRPVQLDHCRTNDMVRRAEYVGFDAAVRQVFVTRQYNVMAYSLAGDCLGTVLMECCTKSPIHLVEGYLADRYLLVADTKGGLWLAQLRGRTIEVRSEWARDPVTSIVLSSDRARAIVVSESGRATLLSLDAAGRPVEVAIAPSGVLAAAFHPRQPDVLAITGADGLAQIWQVKAGRPERLETFSLPSAPVASVAFTADGNRLIAIADDLRVYVLKSGASVPVASLSYAVDWSSSRKVPNSFAEHRPDSFDRVEDAGDRISFPDPTLNVQSVESVNGKTWIFAVRKPEDFFPVGPAFLVEGGAATALPDRDTDVFRVRAIAGSTWLHSSEGLYQLTPRGIRLVLPPKAQVSVTAQIGQALWFGTSQGAWRILADSVARFTRTELEITGITEIDGTLWFAARTGVFRLDAPDQLVRVSDEATSARRVVKIRGQIWILTGSESEPGPAWLVRDLWTRALPSPTSRVADVVEAGGATWLMTDRGLFRVDEESATPIDGIKGVSAVKHLAGRVIAFQTALIGGKPAFEIVGDRAVRLIPEAGVTQTVTANGVVYLATAFPDGFSTRSGPLYRLQGGRAVAVTPGDSRVSSMWVPDGRLWLQIEKGNRTVAARLEQDRIVEPGPEESGIVPHKTEVVEGSRWVLGEGGACLLTRESRRCFRTPDHQVIGVRWVRGRWWLLTRQGFDPGPAYSIDGDAAHAAPDARASVADVHEISGATWLVIRRAGRAAPLLRVADR